MSAKNYLMLAATLVMGFGIVSESSGQGVRIGNFLRAGGGQGFHLRGPRGGIHVGGGQGTRIGPRQFGPQFGNRLGVPMNNQNSAIPNGAEQGGPLGEPATSSGLPVNRAGMPRAAEPIQRSPLSLSGPTELNPPAPARVTKPMSAPAHSHETQPKSAPRTSVYEPRPTPEKTFVASPATEAKRVAPRGTQADIARSSTGGAQSRQKTGQAPRANPTVASPVDSSGTRRPEMKSVLVRDDDSTPAEAPVPTDIKSNGKKN